MRSTRLYESHCQTSAHSVRPPFRVGDWPDNLEHHPEAIALAFEGWARVDLWLRANAKSHYLTLPVVEGFHRTIFENVFPEFAGRLRGEAPRYIPQDVRFGPHYGLRHPEVPTACASLFTRVEELTKQLDTLTKTKRRDQFTPELLKVAAYTHGEVIRIHPFRNGNGRTARECINYFARRYGLQSLDYERPDSTTGYLEATNIYLTTRDTAPFITFLAPRLVSLATETGQ